MKKKGFLVMGIINKKAVNMRLDAPLVKLVDEYAEKADVSKSSVYRYVFEAGLKFLCEDIDEKPTSYSFYKKEYNLTRFQYEMLLMAYHGANYIEHIGQYLEEEE